MAAWTPTTRSRASWLAPGKPSTTPSPASSSVSSRWAPGSSPQESSQTQKRFRKPASELSGAVLAEAMPLKIEAQVVNEKNVEALGREAGAIGEIEISFKVDLR